MEKQKRISRKIFIRWTTRLILGLILWIWYRLTNFQNEREKTIEFVHGEGIPLGISYFGKYYLFHAENSIRAFSTTCTHAGCRIGKGSADTLQCSCHGSQFDGKTGKPLKGPAIKPLQELDCRFNAKSDQWIVKFHSGII
jgi:Rieske Fe-S protein